MARRQRSEKDKCFPLLHHCSSSVQKGSSWGQCTTLSRGCLGRLHWLPKGTWSTVQVQAGSAVSLCCCENKIQQCTVPVPVKQAVLSLWCEKVWGAYSEVCMFNKLCKVKANVWMAEGIVAWRNLTEPEVRGRASAEVAWTGCSR